MKSKGSINNYVAYRIREIRASKKVTAQEVSRRTGIAAGSYSCLENGWYNINLDNLFKILYALEISISHVWPGIEPGGSQAIDDDYLKKAANRALEISPRSPTLDDIYEAVCASFDIRKDQLLSPVRGWLRLSEARVACALLVRQIPELRLSALCSSMGCSLSSLSHLTRRYEEKFERDPQLASKLDAARQHLGRDRERARQARQRAR